MCFVLVNFLIQLIVNNCCVTFNYVDRIVNEHLVNGLSSVAPNRMAHYVYFREFSGIVTVFTYIHRNNNVK